MIHLRHRLTPGLFPGCLFMSELLQLLFQVFLFFLSFCFDFTMRPHHRNIHDAPLCPLLVALFGLYNQ